VRAGEYGRQFPERGRENQAAIWKLAEEGKLKPRVYKEYRLDDWRAAFDSLADRQVIGKSVIVP
jgi:NADPH2:quinone reductase